ncbi:MAG: hypothetical protein AAF707_02220 [Pseudomonadota bacterium]
MKWLLALLLVGAGVAGGYMLFSRGGLVEQVTEARVEQALLANGLPAPMAECMAPRLTDRLSIAQLQKLERFAPQDGESAVPTSTGQALARLRRVDDREAIETVVSVAGGCGFDLMLQRL